VRKNSPYVDIALGCVEKASPCVDIAIGCVEKVPLAKAPTTKINKARTICFFSLQILPALFFIIIIFQ
jgi:hypothetical protein